MDCESVRQIRGGVLTRSGWVERKVFIDGIVV
jgi:hypothetical protein